ncbi:hypothetical protein QJS10_CPA06g02013 [Acorus calamus]|uniref:Uncharacterized protein n=1 Tax=Acorus calamus TaxID=4465 RepID=A0AAV9EHP7_ACOCL|nr:hypothetical protein QJS10_CPA06g02013 [Acorus calamus]
MASVTEIPIMDGQDECIERLDSLHVSDNVPRSAESFLKAAVSLKNQVVEETGSSGGRGGRPIDPTAYTGLLGTAFVLIRSYEATGNPRDLLSCAEIVDTCAVVARGSPSGRS